MKLDESKENGTLAIGEIHPAAQFALQYLTELGAKLFTYQESFASCSISGDRLSEICSETLRRLLNHEPVSDRYLMGLAWTIWKSENASLLKEIND